MFSCILRPYSRLLAKNSYPIQDSLVSGNLFLPQSVANMVSDTLCLTKILWFIYPILNETAQKPYPSQRHITIYLIYGFLFFKANSTQNNLIETTVSSRGLGREKAKCWRPVLLPSSKIAEKYHWTRAYLLILIIVFFLTPLLRTLAITYTKRRPESVRYNESYL